MSPRGISVNIANKHLIGYKILWVYPTQFMKGAKYANKYVLIISIEMCRFSIHSVKEQINSFNYCLCKGYLLAPYLNRVASWIIIHWLPTLTQWS